VTNNKKQTSLIHRDEFRESSTLWMIQTIRSKKPAPTSQDFIDYVHKYYQQSIYPSTACFWLRSLGFSFKGKNSSEVYFDGHERPDVVMERIAYVDRMILLRKQMIIFGGVDMSEEILGEELWLNMSACLYVLVTHDETTAYSKGGLSKGWAHVKSGRMVEKGRGQSRMISAYCSELVGWLRKSAKIINPQKDKVCN
jgi:hypothetical protein